MFMKRTYLLQVEPEAKPEAKAEIQVIEKKQVTRSTAVTDAFFAKPLPKRLYL